MRQCRSPLLVLALLLGGVLLGCDEIQTPKPGESAASAVSAPTQFDARTAGDISGRVTWAGPVPIVPPFEIRSFILQGQPGRLRLIRANPNAPVVDPSTRGVAGAVAFLRGVAPAKGRPWNHAPVHVEQRDRRLHVVQGDAYGRVGFVRRGDEIEMVSRERCFHALHGGGAAFFSLTFPDPNQARRRRLTSTGVVELTSAAGYYWMRGYLFVDDHPYYTCTDAQGRFRLERVPPGRYELVCWHPSWLEERHDRDPETSLLFRVFFRPPVQLRQQIELPPGGNVAVEFTLKAAEFERRER
jgi:hypothetical protein